MSVPHRALSLQIALHTLSVPSVPAGKYGVGFRGRAPPVVNDVEAGSAAEQGGLKAEDFVVRINGTDVFKLDADDVQSLLRQSGGRSLSVCVARPRPQPTTDTERRKALIAVQSKLDAKALDFKLDLAKYSSALSGAQQSALNVLETLRAGPDSSPEEAGRRVVLLELFDSDTLDSPPDSSGEEDAEVRGVESGDPLLDFSKDDSLTHVPGRMRAAGAGGWVDGLGRRHNDDDDDDNSSAHAPISRPPPEDSPPAGANSSATNKPGASSPARASQAVPPASHVTKALHPPATHAASDDVIMRRKKEAPPTGVGVPPIHPVQKLPAEVVEVGPMEMATIDVACRGLPSHVRDWRCGHVQTWLQQLNQSLHSLYGVNFVNHDITGPSLLRLSEDRLADIGVSTQRHRYLLAVWIATLRIKQESTEILELAGLKGLTSVKEEEELEMTYL